MNRLDLNLLVALDALLQERSVTRAAERLGLSQPSLSGSLGRLRRHFGDELLYRSGNTYDLTPLGVHLAERTGVALDGAQRIFSARAAAEPTQSHREFVVVCSDYGAAVIGPRLISVLDRSAPGVRVHLRQRDPGSFGNARERLRTVDALLMPHGFIDGVPHLDLYRDDWVCIVSADNGSVGATLTLDDLARLPWVATGQGASALLAVRALRQLGIELRVPVVVDAFLAVAPLVVGSDLVALTPRRLAEKFNTDGALRVMEPPFDPGPLVEALWWHPDFDRDPEHEWLRQQMIDLAADWFDDDRAR